MKIFPRRALFTLFFVILLTVIPVLSACNSTPTAPTTAREIKVGAMTPSTGPAAEKGAPAGHGLIDGFEYINKELNLGFNIKVMWYDSSYDAAKCVTLTKRFMDDGAVMFITHASKEMASAMETANRAEFPGISAFTSPILYRPPAHIYGQMPDYGDAWAAFANYYVKNIWKGQGKPKMALHLLNNTTGYGARDAAKALADQIGVEIVATEEHAATTSSEIESLTRIKSKNPDIIYISSTPAPTAVIIRNARDLGLFPKIPIASGHGGFTKALVDIAGADVVEGVYGVFPTVTWDDNVPGLAKAAEYVRKNNPSDYGNMDYLTIWAEDLIVAEAIRLAVQNAGFDTVAKGDVNAWRAVEKQGLQKLKDYKVAGIHGPVTYTPGDNRLDKSLKLFQIKGGKIGAITDWIESPLIKYEDYSWWNK
jgi:branched-chain amino acid transport system substrate-binding protein